MTAYLRLLLLRTRRVFLSMAFGLPALAPTGIFATGLVVEWQQDHVLHAGDIFAVGSIAALLATMTAVAHLTAFLVHDERRGGRGRLLRLATIDARRPVAAYLCLSSVIAATSMTVGLLVPGLLGTALGNPIGLWLRTTVWAAACATAAGVIGLWLGYLLPRMVTLVAVQLAVVWLLFRLANTFEQILKSRAFPVTDIGWIALAHLLTLLLLPSVWRRTSARLW